MKRGLIQQMMQQCFYLGLVSLTKLTYCLVFKENIKSLLKDGDNCVCACVYVCVLLKHDIINPSIKHII